MRVFLDTNVAVYAFDRADPVKQRAAITILESDERLVVSPQVLLETWWTLTRKLATPLSPERATDVVDELAKLPVVGTDSELVARAIRSSREHQIAIWDALIVEAARSAACTRILSEDLQDGSDFGGILVENPFLADRGQQRQVAPGARR